MNNRKNILLFLGFLLFTIFSCQELPLAWNVDCDPDSCTPIEPDSADLIIHLTINEENPFIPLVFYRGDIEENVIEWVDTANTETLYLYSPVNEFYSIKAFYKSGQHTIVAVDGDKLKTSFVTDVCEYDCWVVKGGILDVRLKN